MWSCSLQRKRTAKKKNKDDKPRPPRARPFMVGSRRSFLVDITAILCHEPVLAQQLGFVHGFASAVEQSAVQWTVSVPNLWYTVFILKLRVAFLTGHQIKLFHLCIRPLFFVCQAHNVLILPRMPGLCHWRLHQKAFGIFGESVHWHAAEAFRRNAQPASIGCRTHGVWAPPNKHFATQNSICAHKCTACASSQTVKSSMGITGCANDLSNRTKSLDCL